MSRYEVTPKLDKDGEPIYGRFLRRLVAKVYRPKLERGSIVQPVEFVRRAKAEAKRARKASLLATQ